MTRWEVEKVAEVCSAYDESSASESSYLGFMLAFAAGHQEAIGSRYRIAARVCVSEQAL
jgi:hypothetical protein